MNHYVKALEITLTTNLSISKSISFALSIYRPYVMALGLNTMKGPICRGTGPTHYLGFDM